MQLHRPLQRHKLFADLAFFYCEKKLCSPSNFADECFVLKVSRWKVNLINLHNCSVDLLSVDLSGVECWMEIASDWYVEAGVVGARIKNGRWRGWWSRVATNIVWSNGIQIISRGLEKREDRESDLDSDGKWLGGTGTTASANEWAAARRFKMWVASRKYVFSLSVDLASVESLLWRIVENLMVQSFDLRCLFLFKQFQLTNNKERKIQLEGDFFSFEVSFGLFTFFDLFWNKSFWIGMFVFVKLNKVQIFSFSTANWRWKFYLCWLVLNVLTLKRCEKVAGGRLKLNWILEPNENRLLILHNGKLITFL